MYDDSFDHGPHPANDAVSFRLMANILDIASSLEETAEALSSDFATHTEVMANALGFADRLKAERRFRHDTGVDAGYKVGDCPDAEWAVYHSRILDEGFSIYAQLRVHARSAVGKAYEVPLARLAAKLSTGFKISLRGSDLHAVAS